MHPAVERAIQEIDAMIYSGCPDKDEIEKLESYLKRWKKGLKEHTKNRVENEKRG